ncbi:hypothetical protein OQJ19_03210 [Fluoribacter gormanii]|uniref:Uncharacterized protein n=1 Tax=Fluoribacter gormanii TaxID=464 RepID=A0A377GHH7_9GAMM|nr:hypothetical protein [Fluoribacter gormanii]KTD02286.1 hypothetical protein Lgor_2042 [Fluoribacter gormanii]MCW8444474.1 hypothetical protein [Fluoribacter gormanii]MCW8469667.1 hypothetical protein [Fluoribacter gormanii]SIR27947.1 hypothetical protein SAMN05421777_10973 [Fluoribacter gormanii]STO24005.1 Uncharacterised protein [Fluoribacter gormanii]
MKFEKIEHFIKKAGFQLIHQGMGFGLVEGRPSYLYQKDIVGSTPQMIQLAVSRENKEDIQPIFSENVPKLVRDSVDNIINNNTTESETLGCSVIPY